MYFKAYLSWIFVLAQILFVFPTKAQSGLQDTTLLARGFKNVKTLYHAATGELSHLYNGLEYVGYPFKLDKGHMYFERNEWTKGRVRYDGVDYENITMMYDLHKGELVIVHLMNNLRIQLIKEKVEGFSLFGHTFERIERENSNPTSPATEFYDVLHNGKLGLLAQRRKQLLESATTSGLVRIVEDKISYYVVKGGRYYMFSGKKGLLKILHDQQRKLKGYIRENKIKFKKDRESSMIRIVKFYDQLND